MGSSSTISGRAAELADRLLHDIRIRRLDEGDQYLRTDEAGRKFHVRKATVNMAMNLLAKQNVLVRSPGRGTFIGPGARDMASTRVQTVYVVVAPDRFEASPLLENVMPMIHRELPGADVHFSFLPERRPIEHIRDLVHKASRAGDTVGFLLVSLPAEVYRFFVDSGLPAVVIGMVYHDSQSLPWIHCDAKRAGRLLADHLVEKGNKRIALLTFSHWRPGDNYFLEGISQGLAAARLAQDALTVRSLPVDPEAFAAEAAALMAHSTRPSAMICRTLAQAEAIRRAVVGLGLAAPGDLELVIGWDVAPREGRCLFPHVRVNPYYCEQVALAAALLQRAASGEDLGGQHVLLPVELVVPDIQSSQ